MRQPHILDVPDVSDSALTDTLGDRVRRTLEGAFQGRDCEVARIRRLLTAVHDLPRLLAISGPPGVGKTALIRAVERRFQRDGTADVVVVDAHEFDHTPVALATLVEERAVHWPRRRTDRPLLLVIDAFETITLGERRRLREVFLAGLRGPVLLAVCDRGSVNRGRCQLVGWRSVEERMPLAPLTEAASLAFLAEQGVTGTPAQQAATLSAGNALVLAVAGELSAHVDDGVLPARAVVDESARLVVSRLRREGLDDELLSLLEVSAVLSPVNEEILSGVLGRDVGADFQRMAALSIAERSDDGYRVIPPFDRILSEDVRSRRPGWCSMLVERRNVWMSPAAPASPLRTEAPSAARGRGRRPRSDRPSPPVDQVKRALAWLRDPTGDDPDDLVATLGLDGQHGRQQLRQMLIGAIAALTASQSLRVAEAGFLLRDYYLRAAASLEMVAERLDVSRATLFRRLSLGHTLVGQELESIRVRPGGAPGAVGHDHLLVMPRTA